MDIEVSDIPVGSQVVAIRKLQDEDTVLVRGGLMMAVMAAYYGAPSIIMQPLPGYEFVPDPETGAVRARKILEVPEQIVVSIRITNTDQLENVERLLEAIGNQAAVGAYEAAIIRNT